MCALNIRKRLVVNKGFSLFELMLVLGLMNIVIAGVFVMYSKIQNTVRENAFLVEARPMEQFYFTQKIKDDVILEQLVSLNYVDNPGYVKVDANEIELGYILPTISINIPKLLKHDENFKERHLVFYSSLDRFFGNNSGIVNEIMNKDGFNVALNNMKNAYEKEVLLINGNSFLSGDGFSRYGNNVENSSGRFLDDPSGYSN